MEEVAVSRRKHSPLISSRCEGFGCHTCPTWWKYWVTGVELRGKGDNATFRHDATEDHRGRPYAKLSRARWRRVCRRWTLLGIPVTLTILQLFSIVSTVVLFTYFGAVLSLAAWSGWTSFTRFWPDRKLHKRYVIPAARVLCAYSDLKLTYRKRNARALVSLPRGFGQGVEDDQAASVRITIPGVHALTVQQKAKISKGLAERLDMEGAVAEWRNTEVMTTLDLFPPQTPPRALEFADVRKVMDASELHAPFAGYGPGRKPILADLASDSPHVALSGKSGTGKSVLYRVLLSQRVRKGVGLVMLDYKRWSHKWLHDLPEDRVVYRYRIEEIHEFAVRLGEELHIRINCKPDELGSFREIDVCIEEINATIGRLMKYWKAERARRTAVAMALKKEASKLAEESDGMLTFEEAASAVGLDLGELALPATSPAISAIQELVGMGRELQIHLWVAAQRLSASVFGPNGGDIRESFDLRFIARWDHKLWKMLVDGMKFLVCPAGPRGIWGVQLQDEFHVFRVPWMTDQEARDFACASPTTGPILGGGAHPEALQHPVRPVTLAEALPFLQVGGGAPLAIEGLRTASKRPGFPPALEETGPRGAGLYDLDELKAWRGV